VIAHLSGELLEKHVQRLVVGVGGVGYEVLVPLSTFYAVGEPGQRVTLRIHTRVTDDAIQLFGFQTALEQQLFERLIAVTGIGPKIALSALSGIEPAELVRAVRQNDIARLTRVPGIGRKTAERLALELKDRLPEGVGVDQVDIAPGRDSVKDDVLSALVNLGYQRAAVEQTVEQVAKRAKVEDFEPMLREVLKDLARGAGRRSSTRHVRTRTHSTSRI
jgi:Holliday junction DNA helicase RuvA